MDAQVRFQLSSGAAPNRSQQQAANSTQNSAESRSASFAFKAVSVPTGSALIDAIVRAGLPIASACGADGLCGRCGVEVLAGSSTLAPETDHELRIKNRNRVDPKLRLACRTRVTADIEITTSYW